MRTEQTEKCVKELSRWMEMETAEVLAEFAGLPGAAGEEELSRGDA